MKYLLLICMEEPPGTPLETPAEIADWDAPSDDIEPWLAENERARHPAIRQPGAAGPPMPRQCASGMARSWSADGPYAETKEWMAGFDVLECADMSEAIEIAARHPVAQFGMIEVRPFRPGTGRARG